MNAQSIQLPVTGTSSAAPSRVSPATHGRRTDALLLETLLVPIAAVLAVRAVNTGPLEQWRWLIVPAVLTAAAFIPAMCRKEPLRLLGFNRKHLWLSVRIVALTCFFVFPPVLLTCWLLKTCGYRSLLVPALPAEQNWIAWLVYQFMYVAAAEELFFRGYLQRNIQTLIRTWLPGRQIACIGITILLSAGVFAAAHVIVQGHALAALTFLPGLILAWLLVRTRSLLAPILFHALANTFYFVMAAALA